MEVLFAYYHGPRGFTAPGAATFRLGITLLAILTFCSQVSNPVNDNWRS